MKPLLLALLTSVVFLHTVDAQTEADQFNKNADYCKNLAVKLYPDTTVGASPLVNLMLKMDGALKANGSKLYTSSTKPIILAVEAADILKIQPHWEAITEGERNTLFLIMADGIIDTKDLVLQPTVAASSDSQTAAQQPFNPGSMNNDVPATSPTPQAASPATSSVAQPTVAGFHFYFASLQSQSRGKKIRKINSTSGTIVFSGGPLDNMSDDEAAVYAQQQWELLPSDQQMAYEQKAQFYGDPIAKEEAAKANSHSYHATVHNPDGTVSNVDGTVGQ